VSIHEVSMSFLKILLNYCFPWRPSDLSGEGLPCFRGLSEKAAGGRGGAPLMFTPEVSLTSMKILFNYCFSWRGVT
jgi:hypothetical protein